MPTPFTRAAAAAQAVVDAIGHPGEVSGRQVGRHHPLQGQDLPVEAIVAALKERLARRE
jgi:hypothetical protein